MRSLQARKSDESIGFPRRVRCRSGGQARSGEQLTLEPARLDSLADVVREVVAAKKPAGIPDSVKTYSNYDPTWGNESFVQAGETTATVRSASAIWRPNFYR